MGRIFFLKRNGQMPLRSFFKYLDMNFKTTAPLYNWRHIFGGASAFPAFKDKCLIPTGELANTIFCISCCDEGCGSRLIVRGPDGKIRAVCSKDNEKHFHVSADEIVIYKLKINSLTETVAKALKEKSVSMHEHPAEADYPVQPVFPFALHCIHKKVDGESEKWYVDGKLKKVYGPKKKHSIQSKILNILYDQIGNGWIPHQTFINATGCTEEQYWGIKNLKPGYMQQHLRHIRKHLQVKILFNNEQGVMFSEEVVK
jgi:hypothetical protein